MKWLRILWRNRLLIISSIQLAKEYGPPVVDYVKEKTEKTIQKLREWLKKSESNN
jgi:hypothetical protein